MGVFSLLLVFTAQTWAFIPNDIFATKDERLFELFCVDTVEELEAVGKSTKLAQKKKKMAQTHMAKPTFPPYTGAKPKVK